MAYKQFVTIFSLGWILPGYMYMPTLLGVYIHVWYYPGRKGPRKYVKQRGHRIISWTFPPKIV